MGVTVTETTPLPSWTRTLNEAEALTLLDHARPGLALEQWAREGHDLLPQASLPRRRELIRIVREDLLDHDGTTIVDSLYGRLLRGGSPHRRRGLLYGRLLARRPLIAPALSALVLPALARVDAPLAASDADIIPGRDWDAWLYGVLRPGIPDEAFKKTRSTLQTALADAGVVSISGSTTRVVRVRHGEPDGAAWAWVLAAELASSTRETSDTEAVRVSFAARLFGTRPEYGASCIEAGISEGVLRRSYLAGTARVLVGEL
jgi:hypothetical protein